MFCAKCGHEFQDGKFCPNCGQPIAAPVQAQQPIVPPVPPVYIKPASVHKKGGALRVVLITVSVIIGLIILLVVVGFLSGVIYVKPAASSVGVSGNVEISSSTETSSTVSESSVSNASVVGSRKNPARIGDTVQFEMDSFMYGHGMLEITLTGVVRGDEATQAAMEYNSLNSIPEDGKEYVIATFHIKNVKNLSAEDTPIEVNEAQFDFADSSYAKEDQVNFVIIDNALRAELYEGAETTGTVVLISSKDDSCFAVYQDTMWFALS